MQRVAGTDVSAYQRTVDWREAARGGLAFGVAKATEGLTISSPLYAAQVAGARDAGLLTGAYHFFRISSPAIAQVRRFAEIAAGAGTLDLPLALDVEEQHARDPLGGAEPGAFADAMIEALEELARLGGKRPLLYISPGFAARLPDRRAADVADLWVAHYGVRAPTLPRGFSRWALWQTSGTADVPGVVGPADADVFDGTREQLEAYARGEGLPALVSPGAGIDVSTTLGVQQALNALVSDCAPLVEDGIDGPHTRAAVATWQRAHGLPVTGSVDDATRAALRAALG